MSQSVLVQETAFLTADARHTAERPRPTPSASVGEVLNSKPLVAPDLGDGARRESEDEITEREVTILLADFAAVRKELFPAEQARIV